MSWFGWLCVGLVSYLLVGATLALDSALYRLGWAGKRGEERHRRIVERMRARGKSEAEIRRFAENHAAITEPDIFFQAACFLMMTVTWPYTLRHLERRSKV